MALRLKLCLRSSNLSRTSELKIDNSVIKKRKLCNGPRCEIGCRFDRHETSQPGLSIDDSRLPIGPMRVESRRWQAKMPVAKPRHQLLILRSAGAFLKSGDSTRCTIPQRPAEASPAQ